MSTNFLLRAAGYIFLPFPVGQQRQAADLARQLDVSAMERRVTAAAPRKCARQLAIQAAADRRPDAPIGARPIPLRGSASGEIDIKELHKR